MWYTTYVNSRRCNRVSDESKIKLLICKSRSYKSGYRRAMKTGDKEAADKWKDGYRTILEEIDELKQKLA